MAPGQQAGAAGQDLGDASRVPGDMQGDAETGARRHGHTQEGRWTLAKSGAMSILCDPAAELVACGILRARRRDDPVGRHGHRPSPVAIQCHEIVWGAIGGRPAL